MTPCFCSGRQPRQSFNLVRVIPPPRDPYRPEQFGRAIICGRPRQRALVPLNMTHEANFTRSPGPIIRVIRARCGGQFFTNTGPADVCWSAGRESGPEVAQRWARIGDAGPTLSNLWANLSYESKKRLIRWQLSAVGQQLGVFGLLPAQISWLASFILRGGHASIRAYLARDRYPVWLGGDRLADPASTLVLPLITTDHSSILPACCCSIFSEGVPPPYSRPGSRLVFSGPQQVASLVAPTNRSTRRLLNNRLHLPSSLYRLLCLLTTWRTVLIIPSLIWKKNMTIWKLHKFMERPSHQNKGGKLHFTVFK